MEQEKNLRYYWEILWARKSYFLWPLLIVFLLSLIVALVLPPTYESSATILIEEQQIAQDFLPSTVVAQRIQSLTQQILSSSRLMEVIKKYNLYPEMQKSPGDIITLLRENITLEPISEEFGETAKTGKPSKGAMTVAVRLSYRGRNPETVQKVTETLASLYLQENIKLREEQAKFTTKFLEKELGEIKARISTIGQQITTFKAKHGDILPELQQFNRAQAERLETEIKQIDAQVQAVQDRKILLGGQLAALNEGVVAKAGPVAMDPISRLAAVRVELAGLQAKFSEDHPDIRKLRREKAELEKMVGRTGGSASLTGDKISQLKTELADKQGRYSDQHPEILRLKREIAELQRMPQVSGSFQATDTQPMSPAYYTLMASMKAADVDTQMLLKRRADLQLKYRECCRRLEAAPQVEQEYLALTRDYENATAKHQEIMNKLMTARIAEGMEESQKGQKFTLVEAANKPEQPVSPNRPLILLAGLLLGLMAGGGTVALMEHLDNTIKSADELASLTGLPVLGRIALIKTS